MNDNNIFDSFTLPTNWAWVTIQAISQSMKNGIYKPESFYSSEGVPCLRMYNIDRGKIVWKNIKRMTLDKKELLEYGLLHGDILVNRVNSRELVGKAAAIPAWMKKAVFESKNIRLRLNRQLYSPSLASYWLLLHGARYFNRNAQQTVGMASINQKQLGDMPIPLIPRREQDRIADKIDELFTRIDAGIESLAAAQALLKRYRASVLKAACEGRLVPTEAELARQEGRDYEPADKLLARILKERRAAWEAAELEKMARKGIKPKGDAWKKKYKEPAAPKTEDLPGLPEGWIWTYIAQLGDISGGVTKNAKRESLPIKLPYLRVANVYANRLNLDDVKTIGLRDAEVDGYLLLEGDLLVVEGNGSVDQIGRVCIWDGSIKKCVHQNHIIKARFPEHIEPHFIVIWLLSEAGRDYITSVASSTSGLHTLSISKVSALPIPLPPIQEQRRIVNEVDRLLSTIDSTVEQANSIGHQAQGLRQAILKAAFEGKLVSQDPNDEPASVLLERIKAARDQAKPSRNLARTRRTTRRS